MSETFSIDVHYGIKYTTKKAVPITEIIESLANLEKLLKRTPAFVEKAFHGIEIVETRVFVSKIESGSLVEDFLVRFVFKGKDNYDQAKQVFDKIMEDNAVIKTVVAMGVGGLITYGAMQAIPKGQPTSHIEAYNNTIINVGASIDFSADDFKAVLNSITDKKSLAKEAIGAIKPARADASAGIEVSGLHKLTFPAEAIAEAPEEYDPPAPQEREVRYQNTEVMIYASDRDKNESGWAGIVPSISERRTAFTLGEGVDPSKLHGRTRVRADIIVYERYVPAKKRYEPKKIEIVKTN